MFLVMIYLHYFHCHQQYKNTHSLRPLILGLSFNGTRRFTVWTGADFWGWFSNDTKKMWFKEWVNHCSASYVRLLVKRDSISSGNRMPCSFEHDVTQRNKSWMVDLKRNLEKATTSCLFAFIRYYVLRRSLLHCRSVIITGWIKGIVKNTLGNTFSK